MRDQCLKTRIVSNRVPFPAKFQIVERDTVISAIGCAWYREKMFKQTQSAIRFAYTCVNQSEHSAHHCTVESILLLRSQLHRFFALGNCLLLITSQSTCEPIESMPFGNVRRLF